MKYFLALYQFLSFPKPSHWETRTREYGSKCYADGFREGRLSAYEEGYQVGVEIGVRAKGAVAAATDDDLMSRMKPTLN